jgi:hypothetical protein
MKRWVVVMLLAALGGMLGLQRVDAYEASIRTLRRAVTFRNDGSHHAMLVSLRNLHDPALKPLFHRLAAADHWSIQIDGILGLAELEPTPRIDPFLVARLKSADDRTLIIKYALNAELIDLAQLQEMLEWKDLQPLPRALLLAASSMMGRTPDPEQVAPLTEESDDAIAGLAACILRQGGDAKALETFATRLEGLNERQRSDALFELFRAIEQFRLDQCADFVVSHLQRADLEPAVVEAGLIALLALKPDAGVPLWEEKLGPDAGQSKRVRYGLLLLNAAAKVPPATFDRIRNGDRLLDRMADAGRAIAAREDVSDPLYALLELGHAATSAWAMSHAAKLPADAAAPFYLRIVDHLQNAESDRASIANLMIDAASRLIELDPEAIIERMARLPDDGLVQEALLLGLLNSRSPRGADAAARVKRLGAGRADSMALLLIARHAPTLAAQDLEQLGRIAAGGGRVDETLQAQAAWLYLRHSKKTEEALTTLFATS